MVQLAQQRFANVLRGPSVYLLVVAALLCLRLNWLVGIIALCCAVGFVDARLGDINGCRTAEPYRELGNQSVEDCLDLLPLGEISIPFLFLLQGSLLAQRGIRYLASTILNSLSPRLFDREARGYGGFLQGTDDLLFFFRCKIF